MSSEAKSRRKQIYAALNATGGAMDAARARGCGPCRKGKHRRCFLLEDVHAPGGIDEGPISRCACYVYQPTLHDAIDDPAVIVTAAAAPEQDTSMPTYDARPGERIDIVVRGYVTYNAGGYLNIADKPLEDGEPREGSARLDIPEWMIVDQPNRAPLYPHDALLLVRLPEPGTAWLYRYVDEPGFRGFESIVGNPTRIEEREFLSTRDDATIERLYREGEED